MELSWYRAEYAEELLRLARSGSGTEEPSDERLNVLRLRGERPAHGFLSADIVFGAGYALRQDAENVFTRAFGIRAMGYASEYLGASLRWYDNGRRGIPYDAGARRVPEQGIVKGPSKDVDRYDWEVAEGQFTFSLPWLRLGLQKADLWWGSGRTGAVILSDKAPSFPAMNLHVLITDWLRLDYMHGWLFSDTLEAYINFTGPGAVEGLQYFENKFFAAHAITARVMPSLQVALGESIVYNGGSVNPLFLLPVLPFRAADRWTRATTGNAQLFADLRWRALPSVIVYGTGYIDELDYSKIMASDKTGFDYHVAYTVGGLLTDAYTHWLPLASETRVEFSRVYPYVYTNPKPVQRYSSHNVVLGHWIGANADILFLSHTVHPLRAVDVTGAVSFARYGQSDMFLPAGPRTQPAFLYGHEYSQRNLELRIRWMPLHDLYAVATVRHVAIQPGEGYKTSVEPEGLTISLRAAYGLW
ncbi:MAG: capsule assembly Wzi family protein [Bacteroidia bacterium]|nr:capsule assembly Wzi family protein [Bacteroidia bacterium]